MRKAITVVVLLFCLHSPACADGPVIPPSGLNLRPDHATVQLFGVYAAYAQAVKDHGTQGLREFAAPDFALRSQGRRLTDEKAFQELSPYLDDLHDTRFTVSVRPLAVSGNTAVALTRETSESMSPGDKQTWRLTWYWKQTWHKTTQGWKLVTSLRDEGKFASREGFTFTTVAQATDPLAAERGKMKP